MTGSAAMDRRSFMKAAGLAFLATLKPSSLMALERADAVYASGIRMPDGSYAIATVTESGKIVDCISLPARAHGMACHGASGKVVAFARRPGTYAMAFDHFNKKHPVIITAPENRHFYGHGAFSPDGRFLYASENDFDQNRGMIGIYDTRNAFQRIGEFESFGIGPHDITLSDDGRSLIVANGGIETHPDTGRTKLNLSSMRPSLTLIDAATGSLIEKHVLEPHYSKLSTRHVAVDGRNRVWFACQYEGHRDDLPPLIGSFAKGDDIAFLHLPEQATRNLANYVGAIAVNRTTDLIGVSSPKGGAAIVIDAKSGRIVRQDIIPDAAGIAPSAREFVVSSYDGRFAQTKSAVNWDQHVIRIAR